MDFSLIKTEREFLEQSIKVFKYQALHCEPYKEWLALLDIDSNSVDTIEKIPFLPIELFKNKKVYCGTKPEEIIFLSSSTTGQGQSYHYVEDLAIYEKSFCAAFNAFYCSPQKYAILGLLPSYLERSGSSLIYMVDYLIKQSHSAHSGFFLNNYEKLYNTLITLQKENTPTILIGVSYALLDFIEQHSLAFPNLIVMETGGMKGKREEISREALHKTLCKGFGVDKIHSEYGMTELLSQAYSKGDGRFFCPPWMKVLIRDIYNPFKIMPLQQSGGINIIDLANINSCSFIATQDLGKINSDNSFEILGRFDASDIRGCNLLVQ